jgi:hypothetical protein
MIVDLLRNDLGRWGGLSAAARLRPPSCCRACSPRCLHHMLAGWRWGVAPPSGRPGLAAGPVLPGSALRGRAPAAVAGLQHLPGALGAADRRPL